MTTDPAVRIERLRTVEHYRECERLQHDVWRMSDEMMVVPLHLLMTLQKSGGIVLGAFTEFDELVGFVCGFPGLYGDGLRRLKHCSHMMGVSERYRGKGVGEQLKLAQREIVLSQGLDLITWTYDPLESLSAALNIGKLGTVCKTYLRDLYGPMDDALNGGLPSDRFDVDWHIRSLRVAGRLTRSRERPTLSALLHAGARIVNPASVRSDGPPCPADTVAELEGAMVLVEIPSSIQAVKTADLGLAHSWRLQTRELFESAFSHGYTVTDFVSEINQGPSGDRVRRSVYVLTEAEVTFG